jgi:hypothetical protein
MGDGIFDSTSANREARANFDIYPAGRLPIDKNTVERQAPLQWISSAGYLERHCKRGLYREQYGVSPSGPQAIGRRSRRLSNESHGPFSIFSKEFFPSDPPSYRCIRLRIHRVTATLKRI